MVVRTQGTGHKVTGLYIGARNARRHFPRHLKSIELQLGNLRIHCDLEAEFWQGRPEIDDARLGGWLESRIFHGSNCRVPAPLALIPLGNGAYRLHPFPMSPDAVQRLLQTASMPPADKEKCGGTLCRPRRFIDCTTRAKLQ